MCYDCLYSCSSIGWLDSCYSLSSNGVLMVSIVLVLVVLVLYGVVIFDNHMDKACIGCMDSVLVYLLMLTGCCFTLSLTLTLFAMGPVDTVHVL